MNESKAWYFIMLILLTNFIVLYFQGVNYILFFYFIITLIITQYIAIYYPKKTVIKWLSNIDKNEKLKFETLNRSIKKKLKTRDIYELKKYYIKKIRKNFSYYKSFAEDVFIYKYPKYGKKLQIKNYLSFNKAIIVLNLTGKELGKLNKEILDTCNIRDSYVFIMNIYVKSDVIKENEDVNCLPNKENVDFKNNKIIILNFWLDLNKEAIQFVSPIFKIYLNSQYISYDTMSYFKRKGDPIEHIKDDNKKFIYSKIQGIDNLIKYLFDLS